MSEDELKAIEAREKAATKGPWTSNGTSVHGEPPMTAILTAHFGNAEFIAHARKDIPALLAEVRSLRAAMRWRDEEDAKGLIL